MKTIATLLVGAALAAAAAAQPSDSAKLRQSPAVHFAAAASAPLLGAARAGERIVAVGARGVVLLSDDAGKRWRQAQAVPVRSTLTDVHFVDAQRGWAVGHDGVILASADGGEHWRVQRVDTSVDRPLFSVSFLDAQRGVAVGLWSLILVTGDGGAHWQEVKPPKPPDGGKADRNLFHVFADRAGTLYVAAERGTVLRSKDAGATWDYLDTGYKGSLWSGLALGDDGLVVAGLRGSVFRSDDHGATWQAVASGTKSSITDLQRVGADLVGVGLDGALLRSSDGGRSFKAAQREDRLALTAVVAAPGGALRLFSEQGVVAP
ncbi:MAG TPA: YCF48-related protein [Burkholderiaceae bacterium]